MATAGDVVSGALRYIQYQSAYEPVTAEDMSDGIEVLNDMMASWSTDGVRLGYNPVNSSGDYITAPPQSLLAIKQNLGVMMAPMFQTNALPALLIQQAEGSLKRLKGMTVVIGDTLYGGNAPMGSGNDLYGDYTLSYYGDIEGSAYAQLEFSGNSTAESLTIGEPAPFTGITWEVKQTYNFTATTGGVVRYTEDGIIEARVTLHLLLRGTGNPSQATVYIARNNEHIESSAATVALDDAQAEKLIQVEFSPIGLTKSDTLQIYVKSTATAVTAVSGYMEVNRCE